MTRQEAHTALDALIARRTNGSGMDDRDSVMPEAIDVLLQLLEANGLASVVSKFNRTIAETIAQVEAAPVVAPRPSLPEPFEIGIKVGYSDNYLTELGHERREKREGELRDRWGIVRGYRFYDADGKGVQAHDPNGTTIADVAWAAEYRRIPVDPEDEGTGVHILNLTKLG